MKVPAARKLASGSYNIQLRLDGESISITEATEKACVRKAQLIKAEYKSGKKIAVSSPMTLTRTLDAYIDSKSNVLSVSTIRGYKTIQRNYFQRYMDKRVCDINFQVMVDDESARLSPKTVHNAWRFVASALKYSKFDVPQITLPQLIKVDRPYLDYDQIMTFLEAIKGKRVELPALLALHSLRRSEILALKYEDIRGNIIHVRGSAVLDKDGQLIYKKSNKTYDSNRDIPIMIPRLKELIKDKTGLIFTGRPNTIYSLINEVCEKNGLPNVGVHGLRHSFASLCLSDKVGMSEQEVMELGGWSDYETIHKIYLHVCQKDRLSHANKLAKLFNKNANENANG